MRIFNDTIVLEPYLDSIDSRFLSEAWDELSPFSVDIALADSPGYLDFADRCVYFASIQLKVRTLDPFGEASEEGADNEDDLDLALTDRAANNWLGFRNLSQNAQLALLGQSNLHPSIEDSSSGNLYSHSRPPFSNDDAAVIAFPPTSPHEMLPSRTQTPTPADDDRIELKNIGLAWRGKGYASQALALLLGLVFDELQCHRAQALVMDMPFCFNARALFTSLGFTFEGTRRRAVMSSAMSGWRDVTYMGMLDTEWVVRKTSGSDSGPQSIWDEMFARHHNEWEELLQWEERQRALRRRASMETIRDSMGDGDPSQPPARRSLPQPSPRFFMDMGQSDTSSVHTSSAASSSVCSYGSPYDSLPPSSRSSALAWSDAESVFEFDDAGSSIARGSISQPRHFEAHTSTSSRQGGYNSDAGSDWDLL